jgi:hypothetical protein
MPSSVRSKIAEKLSTPYTMITRYYSKYQTPIQATRSSLYTIPSVQTHMTRGTSRRSLQTIRPSFFSEWTRWFKGKPTAHSMFALFDQFIKDGTGFDTLMSHIKNGDYDEIINTTRPFSPTGAYKPQLTLLDQALTHLIKFNKFGSSSNINSQRYPNLTYTDFFDQHTTPRLIQIIELLIKHNVTLSAEFFSLLYHQLAEYYGLISRGILPPKDSPQIKASFDAYLASIKLFAKHIYDTHKMYNSIGSFDKDFEKRSYIRNYLSEEKNSWLQKQSNSILDRIKSGEYKEILQDIKSGKLDDIIEQSHIEDDFFASDYTEVNLLTLLDRVLQILLKTKKFNSPTDMQGKIWSDIFDSPYAEPAGQ